jgi:hypothetical protein
MQAPLAPKEHDAEFKTRVVTAAQLAMLLEGIDWRRPDYTWRPQKAA